MNLLTTWLYVLQGYFNFQVVDDTGIKITVDKIIRATTDRAESAFGLHTALTNSVVCALLKFLRTMRLNKSCFDVSEESRAWLVLNSKYSLCRCERRGVKFGTSQYHGVSIESSTGIFSVFVPREKFQRAPADNNVLYANHVLQ